jgi:hypothetical protein
VIAFATPRRPSRPSTKVPSPKAIGGSIEKRTATRPAADAISSGSGAVAARIASRSEPSARTIERVSSGDTSPAFESRTRGRASIMPSRSSSESMGNDSNVKPSSSARAAIAGCTPPWDGCTSTRSGFT